MSTSPKQIKTYVHVVLCAILLWLTACDQEYGYTHHDMDIETVLMDTTVDNAYLANHCSPYFGVRYLDSLDGSSLITVAGASCQSEVEVTVGVYTNDGRYWEETRMTMKRKEGFFVVATDAGRFGVGVTEADEPIVCLTIADAPRICGAKDEPIPWNRD